MFVLSDPAIFLASIIKFPFAASSAFRKIVPTPPLPPLLPLVPPNAPIIPLNVFVV